MEQLITLHRRGHRLASGPEQNRTLRKLDVPRRFATALDDAGFFPLPATTIDVMQINVGKVCNQTCAHCHVDAGPDRAEVMSDEVLDRVLEVFEQSSIPTLDVTGGAPELHPRFREMMRRGSEAGRRVIHRCNLTAIMTRPHWDIPDLLASLGVEVVASMPCYTEALVDAQRGDGVYVKSIAALQRLNDVGYGREGSGLTLNLVYNPGGAALPPEEKALEATYKRKLLDEHGIVFNSLFALSNLPISRFLEDLIQKGKLEEYMRLLVNAFNPKAIEPLMCRSMVSVGWDGSLYDCDFNQMLDLKVHKSAPQTIFGWEASRLEARSIVIGEHCFGCTAGAGSSCGGQTT